MRNPLKRPAILQWPTAVLTQGLWSGISLVTSLVLVRYLSVSDFGWFAIALAVRQFFLMIATALVVTPMTVIVGQTPSFEKKTHILSHIYRVVRLFLCATCLVLAIIAFFVAIPIVPMGIFVVGGMALEIQRRVNFVLEQGRKDLFGGVFALVGTLAIIFGLHESTTLSLSNILFAIGALNLLWVVLCAPGEWLKIAFKTDRAVLSQCWSLGRWGLASNFFGYWYSQFSTFLTLGLIGPPGVAILELGRQFVSFIQVLLSGTANLWFPRLSQKAVTLSPSRFLSEIWNLSIFQTGIGAILLGIVLLCLPSVLPMVVPDKVDSYSEAIHVAWIFAGGMIGQLLWQHPSFGTIALGKPHYGFITRVTAVVLVIPIGYGLTKIFGVAGAAWAKVVGEYIVLILSVLMLLRASLGSFFFSKCIQFYRGKPTLAD